MYENRLFFDAASRLSVVALLSALSLAIIAGRASAQDHDKINDANNPLTPKITLNLQNYYVPSLYGLPGREANQLLFRGLIPWRLGDSGQLFRFTMPLATAPTFPTGTDTGAGDLTLMNLTPIPGPGKVTFAVGPLFVAPTASTEVLGAGRYQAGAVGVVIAPQSWGLLGGLLTYQHSFAADRGRDPVNQMTFQPIVNYNLPRQFYLRSSAIWNFDFQNRVSYIPVGLGLGRVFLLEKGITMNAFIEPQFTVWYDQPGAPHWQVFAGVNLQLPVGK